MIQAKRSIVSPDSKTRDEYLKLFHFLLDIYVCFKTSSIRVSQYSFQFIRAYFLFLSSHTAWKYDKNVLFIFIIHLLWVLLQIVIKFSKQRNFFETDLWYRNPTSKSHLKSKSHSSEFYFHSVPSKIMHTDSFMFLDNWLLVSIFSVRRSLFVWRFSTFNQKKLNHSVC